MLQRRVLPRQPPPVGLCLDDLLEHRRTWASSPDRRPPLGADHRSPDIVLLAFFIHSPARPTQPPAPLKSQEPRRPLQRQPRPLLRPATDDSPLPERHYRGELLTVSFPSFHRPKLNPRAGDVPLGLLPHSLLPPARRN
jgi:hypothetical protein